jgi:hypothetical protein
VYQKHQLEPHVVKLEVQGEKTIDLDEDKLDFLLFTMQASFGIIEIQSAFIGTEYYSLTISPKSGLK